MRPIHELKPGDGTRFSHPTVYWAGDDPVAVLDELRPLLLSQDPEDRRDADILIYTLSHLRFCPDGVWAVTTTYAPDSAGRRFSDQTLVWSAHLTEEEAWRWHAAWSKKWSKARTDYIMHDPVQMDRVPLHYLRHPDAEVSV